MKVETDDSVTLVMSRDEYDTIRMVFDVLTSNSRKSVEDKDWYPITEVMHKLIKMW